MKTYMIEDILKIKKNPKFVFYSENERKEKVWDASLEPETCVSGLGRHACNMKLDQETFFKKIPF